MIEVPVGEHGVFRVHDAERAEYVGEELPGHLQTAWRIGPIHALQRQMAGDLVLHGNAVLGPRTLLVVGGKGWGKSSTTAALLRLGARLVADDVLAVYWDGDRPMLRPGHPWLKMWPDTARLAGYDPDDLDRILPEMDKRLTTVDVVPEAVPVDQVLILERGADAAMTLLDPVEAVVHLSAHAHHTPREHGLFGQRQLDECARLARQVPVHRLSIPEGLEHVEAAARDLMRDA